MTAPWTAKPDEPLGHHLVRSGTVIVPLLCLSGTASAHQGVGHGGTPVQFPVVLWVPVLTGLLGGIIAVRYQRVSTNTHNDRLDGVLGILLIALGGSFAITALSSYPIVGIAGAIVGALVTRSIVSLGEGRSWSYGPHVNLTVGGICTHRLLEGMAIGTLYTFNASVGIIGVAVIAGHTALETAAVGGLYSSRRAQAIVAIVLVQIGYLGGTVAGVVGTLSVPPLVQFVVIGVLAGVLFILGLGQVQHTVTLIRPCGVQK